MIKTSNIRIFEQLTKISLWGIVFIAALSSIEFEKVIQAWEKESVKKIFAYIWKYGTDYDIT